MDINEKFIGLHKSLMELSHEDGFVERDRQSRLKGILSLCAKELSVSRVSIWALNESKDSLQCELVYIRKDKQFEHGEILLRQDFPAYFKAILTNRLINADDASQDPRTSEFTENYLNLFNIKSMLDAPIFTAGKFYGVLCIEQAEQFKVWDIAEMSYAASVADTISLINEHDVWVAAKEKVEFLERCDSLTGLENRRFFQRRLEGDAERIKGLSQVRALVLIGLDYFTEINDTYGPLVADYILTNLADRYQTLSNQEKCLLSRVGGDVFAFWLQGVNSKQQLDDLLKAVERETHRVITIADSKPIEPSGSIGVFTYPQKGLDIYNPIRCAEVAMERSKTQNRGSITYFSVDWINQIQSRKSREGELLTAFDENQLAAFYQPIVSSKSKRVVGLEALVRWQHPSKGLISPFHFLPLVSELGLMGKLGDFMIRQACHDIKILRAAGIDVQWISVNLSADQLYNPSLTSDIEKILREFEVPSHVLELEIVEELISQDSEIVRSQITAISNLGVRLSIDDFGTGFSSLSRLKHLPVSKLKIDKSFVDGLPHSEDDKCITRSIIGLAKGLKLDLVAEGVELEQQADWLIEEGCDYIQGYLYSKPVEFNCLIESLKKSTYLGNC